MRYDHLQIKLDELEQSIEHALIDAIDVSKDNSTTHQNKCIKVNVFNYKELIYINEELVFLDKDGYHYSLYSECTNQDLIEILNNLK